MILPYGEYRYEILSGGVSIAFEEARLATGRLNGIRTFDSGSGRFQADATLDADNQIVAISVRYDRGPFARSASYRADGELLRGTIETLAARNAAEAKLGRFREIDGSLVLFKALIIAHARIRGQNRFTGRVAIIDPNTLKASSRKQTYRCVGDDGLRWIFEPLMGESEQLDLDDSGRIARTIDRRGTEIVLRDFHPAL